MKNDLSKNRIHEICIDKTDCQSQEKRGQSTADLKSDSTIKDAYQKSQSTNSSPKV